MGEVNRELSKVRERQGRKVTEVGKECKGG